MKGQPQPYYGFTNTADILSDLEESLAKGQQNLCVTRHDMQDVADDPEQAGERVDDSSQVRNSVVEEFTETMGRSDGYGHAGREMCNDSSSARGKLGEHASLVVHNGQGVTKDLVNG